MWTFEHPCTNNFKRMIWVWAKQCKYQVIFLDCGIPHLLLMCLLYYPYLLSISGAKNLVCGSRSIPEVLIPITEKWAPEVKVRLFHGNKGDREKQANNVIKRGGVCITSYGLVINEVAKLSSVTWDYIIMGMH